MGTGLSDIPGNLRTDDGNLSDEGSTLAAQNTAGFRSLQALLGGGLGSANLQLEIKTVKLDHGIATNVRLNKLDRARGAYVISVGSPDGKTKHSLSRPIDITGSSRSGNVKLTASFNDATATNVPVTVALVPDGNSSQLSATSPVCRARYHQAAAQTFTAGAFTTVNYEVKEYDTDSAVTIGASFHFTCPAGKPGKYHASASFNTAGCPANMSEWFFMMTKNGAEAGGGQGVTGMIGSGGARATALISQDFDLVAGDTLSPVLLQSNATAANMISEPFSAGRLVFSIHRLPE